MLIGSYHNLFLQVYDQQKWSWLKVVQRLNERPLGVRVTAPYCVVAGARKVRLTGPRQSVIVMTVERGPASGTTHTASWPHLVDLFGPLSDATYSRANDYQFNPG